MKQYLLGHSGSSTDIQTRDGIQEVYELATYLLVHEDGHLAIAVRDAASMDLTLVGPLDRLAANALSKAILGKEL